MTEKDSIDLVYLDNFFHDYYEEVCMKYRERQPEEIVEMLVAGYCKFHGISVEYVPEIIESCKNSGPWDGCSSLYEEYIALIKEYRRKIQKNF